MFRPAAAAAAPSPVGAPETLSLPPNLVGNDYIIGDLHGNKRCLEAVLRQLTARDRLFIVGDVTDRGPESLEIIELILLTNEKSHYDAAPQIYVIRGNHEEMCLQTIEAHIELLKADLPEFDSNAAFAATLSGHRRHIEIHNDERNGGGWLLDLIGSELDEKKITITAAGAQYTRVQGTVRQQLGGSKVELIEKYFSSLPYIIHVQGARGIKPFVLTHSDMPFDDAKLLKHLEDPRLALSDKEIHHMVWARPTDPQFDARKDGRILFRYYVGHNIIIKPDGLAVREESETINLDGGAYFSGYSVMANHTAQVATLVPMLGRPLSANPTEKACYLNDAYLKISANQNSCFPLLQEKVDDINEYLKNVYIDYCESLVDILKNPNHPKPQLISSIKVILADYIKIHTFDIDDFQKAANELLDSARAKLSSNPFDEGFDELGNRIDQLVIITSIISEISKELNNPPEATAAAAATGTRKRA